ncbi:MAG: hypothetical protein ACFB50_11435 [Rubrobacteraceae bacterium]
MVWEWRLRRCFDDFAEAFQVKGWEIGPGPGEIPILMGWTSDYCVLFYSWDHVTGDCWFEVSDRGRWQVTLVNEIPTPNQAAELLSDRTAVGS